MNPNHTEDPENILLSSVTNGNAQKRVGRSFKQFDLRHSRQVGTENLPKEVRIASEFIRKASGGKISSRNSKKSGRSVFLQVY